MKTITTALLTVLFALSMHGQQAPIKVSLSHNLTMTSAGEFEVDVKLSDFKDIYTFQLFLNWDENLYRINGATFTNDALPFFNESSVILPVDDVSKPDPGKVRIVWGDAAPLTLPDDITLVTLSFTVLGQPCDISEFKFADIGTEESEQLQAAVLSPQTGDFENIGVSSQGIDIQIPGQGCTSSDNDLLNTISVSVFPNPAYDNIQINLDSNDSRNTQFQVMDATGRLISSSVLSATRNTVNISDLSEGMYMYRVVSDAMVIDQGRITKLQ